MTGGDSEPRGTARAHPKGTAVTQLHQRLLGGKLGAAGNSNFAEKPEI